VYDTDSMERKKSKHAISFPTCLDMKRFMGSTAERKTAVNSEPSSNNVYELKGVLLHKGTSAYHGHYEAQVFDSTYVSIVLYLECHQFSVGKMPGFNSTTKP
jgi:hypothetical protein